jgi:hypothetical protein
MRAREERRSTTCLMSVEKVRPRAGPGEWGTAFPIEDMRHRLRRVSIPQEWARPKLAEPPRGFLKRSLFEHGVGQQAPQSRIFKLKLPDPACQVVAARYINDLGACHGGIGDGGPRRFSRRKPPVIRHRADTQCLGNPDLRDSLSLHSIALAKLCIDLHRGVSSLNHAIALNPYFAAAKPLLMMHRQRN